VKLFDVNVLIYAHRVDTPHHAAIRDWFDTEISGPAAFGMAELVLSGFLRIVTNPKIFADPTPLDVAMASVDQIRQRANCVHVIPGHRHSPLFTQLCLEGNAKGKLVADAYLAALAVEHGCEWISFDRDFARFPGLNWSKPPEG
jgi:toxin-antitoxin system PIN domain toxin